MNFETPIGVSFPDVSVDQTRTLRGHIMAIQRGLRNEVTKRISDYTKIESPQLALGMDSLHAGPCVYWVGKNPCKDDIGGQCSACGYNRVVFPEEGVDEESFLRQQFQAYQVEMDAWIKDGADKKFVLVTGFIGSFFSDYEVSPALRKELLEWLRDDFKERKVEPQVYIEARAEDVIAVGKGGELDELLPLLKNLNARVILGLESRNDFIRTVVFAKQLKIESFEKAARLLQERQIGVNAFVFMGNHSMGEQETFDDVVGTLKYLKALGAAPVLMTPSLTPGSFNDLLAWAENYHFTEPRTLLRILRETIKLFPKTDDLDHYPFMLSLGGGPPEPLAWMFKATGLATCDDCSEKIKEAARQLVIDFDYDQFNQAMLFVDDCQCQQAYEQKLGEEKNLPGLIQRVTANINLAQAHATEYLQHLKEEK